MNINKRKNLIRSDFYIKYVFFFFCHILINLPNQTKCPDLITSSKNKHFKCKCFKNQGRLVWDTRKYLFGLCEKDWCWCFLFLITARSAFSEVSNYLYHFAAEEVTHDVIIPYVNFFVEKVVKGLSISVLDVSKRYPASAV